MVAKNEAPVKEECRLHVRINSDHKAETPGDTATWISAHFHQLHEEEEGIS